MRYVRFQIFESTFKSWETLCEEVASFVENSVGKERLISISHSADRHNGVVVVWYWSDQAHSASS